MSYALSSEGYGPVEHVSGSSTSSDWEHRRQDLPIGPACIETPSWPGIPKSCFVGSVLGCASVSGVFHAVAVCTEITSLIHCSDSFSSHFQTQRWILRKDVSVYHCASKSGWSWMYLRGTMEGQGNSDGVLWPIAMLVICK